MPAPSPPPPSTSTSFEPTYHRPSHRKDFQIAIICALSLEYDATTLLVDEFWDEDNRQYGRTSGDTNFYRNGRIGMHNVVLMLLPNMGKAAVAGSAASLRTSYSNLRVAFLVGVCGGVPMLGPREALLGDVVISEAIIQYDFGRQYPGEFIPKEMAVATQNLPNKDIRTLLAYLKSDTGKNELRQNTARYLKALQDAAIMKEFQYSYKYPGFAEDKLFAATYQHKHRGGSLADPCCAVSESYCDEAALSSCSELRCEEDKLVPRQRLERKRHLPWEEAQCPDIFIGRVASADTVMKSGDHRDQIAKQYNIIAFEMEGAGLWDEVPCIVVKGICDYADSHKNKIWQPFAAATAAAVAKAVLARYTISDHVQLSGSSNGEIGSLADSNSHFDTILDSDQNRHIPPAKPQGTDAVTRKSSSAAALVTVQPNGGVQTLQGAISDFQKALTDDQRRELQRNNAVPEADAVLILTAELDSLNRNRKGRSIASRLHSVLESVRDFSATVEALDSTHLGIAPLIWGSVKLTIFVAVKFVAYYEALSKFFMDFGGFCPRWRDYQIFYSSSSQLRNALFSFYASLIRCCKRAIETTQRSWSAYFFNSSRELFEREFQLDADDIKSRSKYVKDAISLAKTQASYQIQQLQTRQQKDDPKKENLINIFHRKDNRPDKMESWQVQSDERQKEERKEKLLDSLSTHDYLTPFKQSRRKRYSGTLEWLFQSNEYDQWIKSGDCPLLWCSGKIGSGKTVLTASVIDKLLTEKHSSDIFISFFFVRFDDRQSLNAEVILKSITRQMLNPSDLSEEVEKFLDRMRLNLASGLNEISTLLQGIASSFKTLYIVIDGFDECAKQDRSDLLAVLSSIVNTRSNTKLFLAGRDSVSREVHRKFPTYKQLSMDCSSAQSDIAAYVEGIVQEKLQDEELVVGDSDLIEEIKTALSKGANGMFLWVVFQVDELSLQHCDDDIRAAITNLPRSLEETFDRAIDRVVSRGNATIAKKIFRWTAAAKEPLTLDQLREVIFIKIGQQYSKTERRSNGINHISSWCENLVHVDEELNTVQFVHQTVQQFFFKKCSKDRNSQFYIKLEDADHYLGEICVTYLNFNDFQTTLARRQQPLPPMPPIAIADTALRSKWKTAASISTILKFDTRGGSVAANAVEALASYRRDDTGESKERLHVGYPFLRYASNHWISHTSMFRKAESKTWNLWGKMILGQHDLVTRPWDENSKSILEWSRKFHHYALIRLLIQANMITTKDKNGILLNAASEGDDTLLSIILETKDSDLEMCQACLVAARGGYLDITKRLLIAGADGQAAIQRAARGDTLNHITTLLAAGVDGQTALQAAIQRGDEEVCINLLAAGIETPLLTAAKIGDRDTIKLLLSSGSDGQIALQAAVRGSHLGAIRQLLAADIDGKMVLEPAAKNGQLDAIKILLAAGADVNAKNIHGRTALYTAAENGQLDAIKILLAAGADVNAQSRGGTALHTAAENGQLDAIGIILTAGANVNAQFRGVTALYTAAENGQLDAIKILLAAGANVNAQSRGGTALHTAAENGQPDAIEILLAAGADVNAKKSHRESALHVAAKNGQLDAIKILLIAGADPNAQDDFGGTALFIAAINGHLGAIKILLAAGADVNAKNIHGKTALYTAAENGQLDAIKILLTTRADVNAANTLGETVLQAALIGGHFDIVSLLKQAGAK